jgi:hypothetical protein
MCHFETSSFSLHRENVRGKTKGGRETAWELGWKNCRQIFIRPSF